MRMRLGVQVRPVELIGLEVDVLLEPREEWEDEVTIRFARPEDVAAATNGVYGHHDIRVPATCLVPR